MLFVIIYSICFAGQVLSMLFVIIYSICFAGQVLSMLFVIIYALWCPIRFLFHIMFEKRVPPVKRKRLTMPEALRSPSIFDGVRVDQSCVVL